MNYSALAFAAALCLTTGAAAGETDAQGGITLELNTAETVENACKLTFMITNGYDQAVEKAVYETVLFDRAGQVSVITLFDMGTLPPALPRVRQFMVPQVICEDLGRVLVNGSNTCTAEGLPADACVNGLTLTTRTDIKVIG